MIFSAVLANDQHPEYGVASVPFPIPTDQYDEIVGMLRQIELGDSINHDCKLEEVRGSLSVLKHMENTRVNLDELDYLAKRLDSFDEYEKTQFEGMAYRLGLCSTDELINLTFCCQKITVATDFGDLEALGRRHYLTLSGGCAAVDEMQAQNFKEIAASLLESEVGRVTPYGVVYDNSFEMAELYDGRHFPEYRYEDCVMEVEISSRKAPADSPGTYLYLPMSQAQIERAILREGIRSENDLRLRFIESTLPDAIDIALDMEHESIGDLNEMCSAIQVLSREDVAKLGVVVSFVQPECASQISRLTENLDQFEFAPNVHTPEDYGRYMIMESGHFEYDENLDEYYDYERYGRQRMENEQGFFGDGGYISYHGTLSIDELMSGRQEKHMEQSMGGMGGMT